MPRLLDTIRLERERRVRPWELAAVLVAQLVIVCLILAVALV